MPYLQASRTLNQKENLQNLCFLTTCFNAIGIIKCQGILKIERKMGGNFFEKGDLYGSTIFCTK